MDGRQPQIHEIWNFAEDGITREIHPTGQEDVSSGLVGELSTDCLNPSWRRVPMFGRSSINGIVRWIGVPDFLRNNGLPWTFNILSPYSRWVDRGYSTNLNWGSVSGGNHNIVSISWNHPACFLPIYHHRVFENTCSAVCHTCKGLLRENCTYIMQSPSACRNPI